MGIQIIPKVKVEIIKLTSFLASYYFSEGYANLLEICQDEDLFVCEDNYEEYFDGMLVWENRTFHVHLNVFKNNQKESKKGRYTLAHELGHYFINAHREGIKRGLLEPHPSHGALVHSNRMEIEADYFASCLLMPSNELRKFTQGRTFSLDLIKATSDKFNVSLTAAALRFAEVGTHEIMIVFSQNNVVKWYTRSPDFPALANRFQVGGALPPTTVAGESFLKSNVRYITVELVDLEDWFYYRSGAPNRQLYEQCFYSDVFGFVISLIWFS